MHVESMTAGQAVTQALAAEQANRAADAQMKVLDKTLQTTEAMAAELIQAMGIGQNLDVVG
jgi:hypothetical protein